MVWASVGEDKEEGRTFFEKPKGWLLEETKKLLEKQRKEKENRASNILVRPEDEDQDISYSQAAQEVFSSFFAIARRVEQT